MATALITDGFLCIPVNPVTAPFDKSAYPAMGSEVAQFASSAQEAMQRDRWYILLRFKTRENAKWEMKGPLRPITREGFYATEKEA
jgi:hypothetical protein